MVAILAGPHNTKLNGLLQRTTEWKVILHKPTYVQGSITFRDYARQALWLSGCPWHMPNTDCASEYAAHSTTRAFSQCVLEEMVGQISAKGTFVVVALVLQDGLSATVFRF